MSFMSNFITIPPTQSNHNNTQKIKSEISKTITSMPSHEKCLKAALNGGLSLSILDFDKILNKIAHISNTRLLNQILTNLQKLKKQISKLKDNKHPDRGNSIMINIKQGTGQHTFQGQKSSNRVSFLGQKEQSSFYEEEKKKGIQEEINFRVKLKKFYSTEKVQKKEENIKRTAEKAREFNKRALKVLMSQKEKEQKELQNFIRSPPPKSSRNRLKKQMSNPSVLYQRKSVTREDSQPSHSFELTDLQAQNESYQRCKTVNGPRVVHRGSSAINTLKKSQQKFYEIHQRELKTLQRHRIFQQKQQEYAINKMIKKQNKLAQRGEINKRQTIKNNQKENIIQIDQVVVKGIKPILDQREQQIKDKCEQKIFKKQLQLQERVNKIKEELRAKEERIMMHRQKKEQEHEFEIQRNNQFIRSYMDSRTGDREKREAMRQAAIKQRFQAGKHRGRVKKLVNNIYQLSDETLEQQLKRLKDKQIYSSLKNIFMNHIK